MSTETTNTATSDIDISRVNRENMTLWLTALRSGEYGQGISYLKTHEDKFCCLGVACEVAMKNGVGVTIDNESTEGPVPFYRFHQVAQVTEGGFTHAPSSRTHMLPAVAEWLGVDSNGDLVLPVEVLSESERADYIGRHGKHKTQVGATFLNDEFRWSFGQIADAVEKTYLPGPAEAVAA